MSDEEPELIIDTDWKAQVEKEKQQGASDSPASDSSSDDAAVADSTGSDATSESQSERGPIPPATLEMLLTTLYSQTMMSLGALPNPSTNESSQDLPMAKHFIDTVEMLQEKTKGNTSDDESKMFEEVLHVLRMAFVQASKET